MGGYVQAAMMIIGGAETYRNQRRESKSLKKEAAITTEEGLAEAERIKLQGKEFEANQRLSYLKSGVSLRGSPLLVLAETQKETEKQVDAQTRRTFAMRSKLRTQARRARVKGRAGILSSGSSGTGAAVNQYNQSNTTSSGSGGST